MWTSDPPPPVATTPQAGLTIEEALSLLDLLLLCPVDLTDSQQSALQKLSHFCRQGLITSKAV